MNNVWILIVNVGDFENNEVRQMLRKWKEKAEKIILGC